MDFLNRNPIIQEIIKRISKWDYMKLKCLCVAMETVTRVRRQASKQEKNVNTLKSWQSHYET